MKRSLSALGLSSAVALAGACAAPEEQPPKLPQRAVIITAHQSSFQQYRQVQDCGEHYETYVDYKGNLTTGYHYSCETVDRKTKKLTTTVMRLAACRMDGKDRVLADDDYMKSSGEYPGDYPIIGDGQTGDGVECGTTFQVVTSRVSAVAVGSLVSVAELQDAVPDKYID